MIKELRLFTLMDDGGTTPFPSESEQIVINEYEYNAKRMGDAPSISATVNHTMVEDARWSEKIFAEFKGERYFIIHAPSVSKDNRTLMYKYSFTLLSERNVLNSIFFFDVLPSESKPSGDIPVTNSTKVQFFGNVRQYIERLNHFLEYSSLNYRVVFEGSANEEKLVSFENKKFSEAVQEIYNIFKVPYYYDGNTIHVGKEDQAEIGPVLTYGADNGLTSVSKSNANFQIVTRITGTGSGDNIPYYYPNASPKGKLLAIANADNKTLKTDDILISDYELFSGKMNTTHDVKLVSNSAAIKSTEYKIRREYRPYDPKNVKYKGIDRVTFKLNVSVPHDGKLRFRLFIKDVTGPTSGDVYDVKDVVKWVSFKTNDGYSSDAWAPVGFDNIVINAVKASAFSYIEISVQLPKNEKSENLNFVAYPIPNNVWISDGDEINLDEIGIKIADGATVSDGDGFRQDVQEYILPSQKLMPSIYRESKGKKRFYEAKNNTYDNDKGEKYIFHNEYNSVSPKEAVVDFPDIKPSIEGAVNNGLRIDMFSEFAYDRNDSNDIDPITKQYKHPYFFGKLRPLGFNLFDASNEKRTMTISMKSGSCGACEFQIGVGKNSGINTVQVNKDGTLKRFIGGEHDGDVICGREGTGEVYPQRGENGGPNQQDTTDKEIWIALKKDDHTYDNVELMPTGVLRPKSVKDAGESGADTFVILGMTMPQYLVEEAEKKLDKALIKYMFENNNEKFNFSVKLSRIYLAEHPEVENSLNENSMVTVVYGDEAYRMHVDTYKYKVRKDDLLPDIEISIKDTISVHKGQIETKLGEIKGEILSSVSLEEFIKAALPVFLKRDAEDSTNGLIHLLGGAEIGEDEKSSVSIDKFGRILAGVIASKDFNQGTLGTGFSLSSDPKTGHSRMEVDELFVRVKAFFTELQIMTLRYSGGNWVFSPAGEECTLVEYHEFKKGVNPKPFYRCFFSNKDKEHTPNGRNYFEVGDLVQFREFDAKEGTSHNVSSRYYWRKCINKGTDFIDLSDLTSEKDPNVVNDAPQSGDSMVVIGSTVRGRGNAILISTVGSDAPSIKQYSNINTFSLLGRETTAISPSGNKFTGNFVITNTPDGNPTDVTDYIGKQQEKTNQSLGDLATRLDKVEKQNDGAIEFWFGKERPSDDKEPTKTWIAEGSQEKHLADMYYAEDDTAWRYTKSETGTYYWKEVIDSGAKEALEAAQNAQATADGKMKVFIQDEAHPTPEPPYSIGDLWANATYPMSQARMGEIYSDELLRCVTPTEAGEQFNIEHWTKASKYTGDELAAKAEADAKDANDRMESWAADGVISPTEKQSLKDERKRIDADHREITEAYTKYNLAYPSSYDSAYNSYANDLDSLTVKGNEPIKIPSTFPTHQDSYYTERTNCLGVIADASKKYAEDLTNNIQVGGTNILRKSKKVEVRKSESNYNFATIDLTRDIKQNTEYSLSIGSSEITSGSFSQYSVLIYDLSNQNWPFSCVFPISTKKQEAHFSIKELPVGTYSLLVYSGVVGEASEKGLIIHEVKLEEGNKATDWSPAPDDIQSQFEVTNNRITSEISGVKEDYNGKFTETNSQISQTDEAIRAEVTKRETLENTVTDQGSRIEATENSISQKVWKTDIDEFGKTLDSKYSTIDQTEDSINIAVGSIRVGGRNYYSKDTLIGALIGTITVPEEEKNSKGFHILVIGTSYASYSSAGSFRLAKVLEKSGWHTFSGYVRTGSGETDLQVDFADQYVGDIHATEYWTRFEFSLDVDVDSVYNFIDFYSTAISHWLYFSDVMIEEGNKATSWQPNPSDTEAQITETKAQLKVESDRISTEVTERETLGDRVTVNSSNIEQNAKEIEMRVTSDAMTSAIEQSAKEIRAYVSERAKGVNLLPSDKSYWEMGTFGNPRGGMTYEESKGPNNTRIRLKTLLYIGSGVDSIFFKGSTDYLISFTQFDSNKKSIAGTETGWFNPLGFKLENNCRYLAIAIKATIDSTMSTYFADLAKFKVEIGDEPTPYTPCPNQDTKLDLLDTGIDIDAHSVTVTADKFKVQNRDSKPIAVFEMTASGDPVVKAERIDTDKLLVNKLNSVAADGTRTEISGGIIQIFGNKSNNPNIKIGSNADGEAIFKFYDKDGRETLNLSPKDGLTKLTTPYMDAVYLAFISNAQRLDYDLIINNVKNPSSRLVYQYQAGTIGGNPSLSGRYYQSKGMSGNVPTGSYIANGWYTDNVGEPDVVYVKQFFDGDIRPAFATVGRYYKRRLVFNVSSGKRGIFNYVYWE